jgi:GTP cyclohydrolase II
VNQVAAAIDTFRRGLAVRIEAPGGGLTARAVDLLDADGLAAFDAFGSAQLLLSGARAATLKITAQRAAAGREAVLVARTPWMDLPLLIAAADPVDDLRLPLKGPFRAAPLGALAPAANAALALAKLARLLPAALVSERAPADAAVSADAIAAYPADQAARLRIVVSAKVPLLAARDSRVVAFRADDGALEHLAIVVGDPPPAQPVLARLHSECFTGDLLGSLKCDCGPQLQGALAAIDAAGAGVLLYLAQEGRGIGLINKLRAYALQDQGFDTVDANLRLGFDIDERQFAPAARMLKLLGYSAVRLMTNNPDKVAALEAEGIEVAERVQHSFPSNDHNAFYLATKKARTGHLL